MHYPLRLELRPSRRMLLLVTTIHGIAVTSFVLSGARLWIVAAGLLVLALSLRLAIRAENAKSRLCIVLEDSGHLRAAVADDVPAALPLPGSVDFGWAVWLQWQIADEDDEKRGERGAIMLFPDNLPAGNWRLLRIWMRHKASSALGGRKRS